MIGLLAVEGYIALNVAIITVLGARSSGGFVAWWRS